MKRPLAGAALALAALLSPVALAGNVSLTIDEIPGAIEVLSFSWSASNPSSVGSSGGGGSGKVTFKELVISATEHATSPLHFQNVASGRHLPGARLTVMHPETGRPQSEWVLGDVVVSSFGVENGALDPRAKLPNTLGVPVVKISLNFGRACYKVFAADGSVRQDCWSVITNAPA